jgi:hypothetical protein
LKAIEMWWMDDIIVPAVLIAGAYCFVWLVRSRTQGAARKNTRRTAEDLYPLYADSIQKQRKYAKEHGDQWKDDGGVQGALAKRSAPPPKTAPRSAGPMPSPMPKPRP